MSVLAPEGVAVGVPAGVALRPRRPRSGRERRRRRERHLRAVGPWAGARAALLRWAPLAVAVAAAVLIPSIWRSTSAVAPAAPPVTSPALAPTAEVAPDRLPPDAVAAVLGFVTDLRPDDALAQVRPGVFAKRSNVHGVEVGGRVVYYDLFPHQSFGPLRSGRWTEADVVVLARVAGGGDAVLVYMPKASTIS